jgi:DNA invertase Pin-like site-specific DNA recombinase
MKSIAKDAKAYAYIRWSKATQSQGDSEARQKSPLAAFSASTGVEVVETIEDRGVSAYRGLNAVSGRLKGLIERINSGEIRKGDFLVIESIDRLTRQRLLFSAELIQNILKRGVRIYTTIDEKTYEVDDPDRDLENLLMVQVIAKRANEESETKSKRISSAWRKRQEQAKQGVIIIKRGKSIPFGLRYEEGRFVRHEKECAEVERLYRLMLDVGMNTAIKKINETSLRRWSTGHLQKMFSSKSVIGCLTTHKILYDDAGKSRKITQEVIPNYYPNIIDPTLFYLVKDRMAERKVKNFSGKRSDRSYNIFQHVIFCQCCKSSMFYDHRGSSYQDKVYPHFKCETKQTKSTQCDNDRIRFEYVFRAMLEYCYSIKLMDDLAKSRNEAINNVLGHSKETTTQLAERLTGLVNVHNHQTKARTDFHQKEIELSDKRTTYENLERSMERFVIEDAGDIPLSLLKSIRDAEKALQKAKEDVDVARARIVFDDDMKRFSVLEIIELFKTEEGRTKLNGFFKTNRINFYIKHDKASRLFTLAVYQEVDGKAIRVARHSVHTGKPKQKRIKGKRAEAFNILGDFQFKNEHEAMEYLTFDLQDILNETKSTSPRYLIEASLAQ